MDIKLVTKTLVGVVSNYLFTPYGKNILIENYGALGDFVHGIPLIRTLQINGYMVWIDTKENNKLPLPYLHYINEKNKPPFFSSKLILNGKNNWSYLDKNYFDMNAERVFRKYVKKNWKEIHWTDFYLETAEKLFKSNKDPWKKYVPKLLETEKKFIIIHPGASVKEKSWGTENFIWVKNKLEREYPKEKVIFILGPGDQWCKEEFKKRNIDWINVDNLKSVFIILKQAKIFIGNDSGLMHIASLFDLPVFGIFTIGSSMTHYPYGKKCHWIADEKCFSEFLRKNIIIPNQLSRQRVYKEIEKL